jgi:phosphoribosylformylglycinamidine cyclo-ligase
MVSAAAGIGERSRIAIEAQSPRSIGLDIVAACVNGIISQGATPLFFLHNITAGMFEPQVIAQIFRGAADGCRVAGCALLGPEETDRISADYIVASGFAAGIAERRRIIDGRHVRPGHVIIGVAADGLNIDGAACAYDVLVRRDGMRLDQMLDGTTLGEELSRPLRSYAAPLRAVLAAYHRKRVPTGIAAITRAGIAHELAHALPSNCDAVVKMDNLPLPAIQRVVQAHAMIAREEMAQRFNCGIGLAVIVPPFFADSIISRFARAGETACVVGEIAAGKRRIIVT